MQAFHDRQPPRSMKEGRFLVVLSVWLAGFVVVGAMAAILLLAPCRDADGDVDGCACTIGAEGMEPAPTHAASGGKGIADGAGTNDATCGDACCVVPTSPAEVTPKDTAPPAATTEAASTTTDAGSGADASAARALFLWEVRGGTGVVYLFGSVHVGTADFYPLDPAVLRAWDESERLAVEVDMMDTASPDLQRAQALAASRTMIPGGGTLGDHIPPETLELFRAFCEKHSLAYEGFQTMQPWMSSMTLTLWMAGREGYTPFHGLDNFFLRNARARRRPIHSLETAVSQVELLSGQPLEMQMEGMAELIEDLHSGEARENMLRLFRAWERGDDLVLLELVEEDRDRSPAHGEFFEKLLYVRNRDMAAVIHERFLDTEGTTFVVVGAAHLIGERSVQDYLLQRVPTLEIRRIDPVNTGDAETTPDAQPDPTDGEDAPAEEEASAPLGMMPPAAA